MADAPDLILWGGPVLTLEGAHPDAAGLRAEALAVSGGRIAAVGSRADVLALRGPRTRVVGLSGRALLPGFQDAHSHPLQAGIEGGWVDLREAPDRETALHRLREAAGSSPGLQPDRWIEAVYHPAAWPDGRDPTRQELDAAVSDAAVLLHHASGHAVVANTVALAIANLFAGGRDPDRATIDRDEHGEPTGRVTGSDPTAPFAPVMPPLTPDELRVALRDIGGRLVADGVTAASDADLGAVGDPLGELAAYVGAALDGDFPVRLTVMPGLARLARPDEAPPTPADIAALIPAEAAGSVRLGAAKFYADGAFSTRDAWLRDPYADAAANPGAPPLGRPAQAPGELEERLIRAHCAGWQLATHAIGDAALEAALAAYDAALRRAPRRDHRHRVEHALLVPPDLLEEMLRLGVVAVLQPEFVALTGDVYRARVGPERAGCVYAYRRWLDAGLPIAFGSDRPVTGGHPLDGIRSAMRHAGPSGIQLASGVAPTVAEALLAWTASAAWAARDDGHSGRLAPGLRADLVVLSADPTGVPPERWAARDDGIEVVATVVGGEVAFGDGALG